MLKPDDIYLYVEIDDDSILWRDTALLINKFRSRKLLM